MATVDGQEPCFLYDNVLQDATLSVVSGGATLNTGALTNLTDGLTFTTAAFSSFSGSTLTIQADATIDSETFTTVENPLATGWTDVGNEALQATGGYATDASMTAITYPNYRHYVRSAGDAFQGTGRGSVRADCYWSSTSSPTSQGGVSVRQSATGAWIGATAVNTSGLVVLELYTGSALATHATTGSFTLSAATYYEMRLVYDAIDNVKVYVDGTLKLTADLSASMPAGFVPDQQGIIQVASTPASNEMRWDNFATGDGLEADTFAMTGQLIQGATGANQGGSYSLAIEYSDDEGSSWTEVTPKGWSGTAEIGCDMTTFLRWDDTSGPHDAFKFTFTDTSVAPSGDITLGALCLGKRLEFGEYMASGFDPDRVSLKWEQNRNLDGQYVGGVVRNASQSINLTFSRAGVAGTLIHDPDSLDIGQRTRLPSWGHFLKTCWSLGKPWWFQWRTWDAVDGLHCHEGSFYAYPSRRASWGASFMSPTRRRLKFGFDVLAEGYLGDFPLNDP